MTNLNAHKGSTSTKKHIKVQLQQALPKREQGQWHARLQERRGHHHVRERCVQLGKFPERDFEGIMLLVKKFKKVLFYRYSVAVWRPLDQSNQSGLQEDPVSILISIGRMY